MKDGEMLQRALFRLSPVLPWIALAFIGVLLLLCLERVCRSPRLATRLILCQWMALLLLLAGARWGGAKWSLPIGVLLGAALQMVTQRLLAPLQTLKKGAEDGEPISLRGLPATEFYGIGRSFNRRAALHQGELEELQAQTAAYARMVPSGLPVLFGKPHVADLRPGETVRVTAFLLLLRPGCLKDLEALARQVGTDGGLLAEYDRTTGMVTAFFLRKEEALVCADACRGTTSTLTGVLEEKVELGIFGGEEFLFPLVLAPSLSRRRRAAEKLARWGVREIRNQGGVSRRLMGWDDGQIYYEDITWRSPAWLSSWRRAGPLWQQGMELYRRGQFASALRKFARVARLMPGDEGARWYLFRCQALRDRGEEGADTGLLGQEDGQ